MNNLLRTQHLTKASLAALLATALLAFALWPRPAHADWRSLSGGFLPAHASAPYFIISPDSRMVAFVADKDTDDVYELYAVPITGTTPIKLNPTLVAGGDVNAGRFSFTPDSQYVIYLADQEVDNRVELFRVPVGGGQAVKLNPFLTTEGNVDYFKIDPDSGRVVYVADQETDDVFELWSIPTMGGASVKLSGMMVPGGDVGLFEFDRWSGRVVFSADRETDGKFELYSVPTVGGSLLKRNPPIVAGGSDPGIYFFAVNPKVSVVVFIARIVGTPRQRLYMIPTAENIPPIPLSFDLAQNQRILNFLISPTGERVVYNVSYSLSGNSPDKGILYSAPIGGGDSTLLTDFPDPEYGVDSYRITPDGARVVYSFQKSAASRPYLGWSMHSGARGTLYAPGASDPPPYNFDLSPDGQWVMYQTDLGHPLKRLYTIPTGGGNPTDHGVANFAAMLPDSSRIVYTRIVSDANQATDLFSAQVSGGDERNLSGLSGVGYVEGTRVSEDGKWIVFRVLVNGRYDLRMSDGSAAQPPDAPLPTPTPTPSPTPMVSAKVYVPLAIR